MKNYTSKTTALILATCIMLTMLSSCKGERHDTDRDRRENRTRETAEVSSSASHEDQTSDDLNTTWDLTDNGQDSDDNDKPEVTSGYEFDTGSVTDLPESSSGEITESQDGSADINNGETDNTEDNVIFGYSYTNMAWGYQGDDIFITESGNIYFDTSYSRFMPTDDEHDLADYLIAYSEPVDHVDTDVLRELYDAAVSLGDNLTDYEEVFQMYDAGNGAHFFVDPNTGERIVFRVDGSYRSETSNPDLQEFWDMWEDLTGNITLSNSSKIFSNMVNADHDYIMGADDVEDYIFEDAGTLLEYADREWHIDLTDDLDQLQIDDDTLLFVEVRILENYDSSTAPAGLMIQGERAFYMDPLETPDPQSSGEGTVSEPEAEEGEMNPYEFFYSNITVSAVSNITSTDLMTEDGTSWQVMR